MINFDELIIAPGTPLTINTWNGLMKRLKLEIPPNLTDQKLELTNSENGSKLQIEATKGYNLIASPSKPLIINPRNNVGIGVTNPISKLQVHGTIYSSSGGFLFPNKSFQKQASEATNIKTGNIRMNMTSNWKTSPLATGKRTYITPKILLSGFTTTPHIMYSIYKFDAHRDRNVRIIVTLQNVSRTGFKIKFRSWADSLVYHCDVRWMAIGK